MTVRELTEQLQACQFQDAEVVLWTGHWMERVRLEEGGSLQPGYNVPQDAFKGGCREAIILYTKKWGADL